MPAGPVLATVLEPSSLTTHHFHFTIDQHFTRGDQGPVSSFSKDNPMTGESHGVGLHFETALPSKFVFEPNSSCNGVLEPCLLLSSFAILKVVQKEIFVAV